MHYSNELLIVYAVAYRIRLHVLEHFSETPYGAMYSYHEWEEYAAILDDVKNLKIPTRIKDYVVIALLK